MKIRVCIYLMFFISRFVVAQSDILLSEYISEALSGGRMNQAVMLFTKYISKDRKNAEKFYWLNKPAMREFAHSFSYELALSFESDLDSSKALLYYKEAHNSSPKNLAYIIPQINIYLCEEKEKEAIQLCHKVIEINENNVQANIVIGNFYFFKGLEAKESITREYKAINKPTRMQYGKYKDDMLELLKTHFFIARKHLEKVMELFPSTEAKKTLQQIDDIEKEISRQ